MVPPVYPQIAKTAHVTGTVVLKAIIEKVRCDKPAIRDALAATKDWKGRLIDYQAYARGDLAHTLGIYRNKGKTPELAGPIKESGF